MIDYGMTLLAGFLASLHCIGMCGAIVLAYSTQPAESGQGAMIQRPSRYLGEAPKSSGHANGWRLHLAYNGGRVLSYAALGSVVALAGTVLSSIEMIGEYLSIAAGGVMVVGGAAMLGILPISSTVSVNATASPLRKLHASLLRARTPASKLSLGLLTPLLPCGVLYAMLAKAAASGSALAGAATMGLFGAGMAPSLMMVGSASLFLSARVRKGSEQIAAGIIIVMGVVLILRGLHVPYLTWLSGGEAECSCREM